MTTVQTGPQIDSAPEGAGLAGPAAPGPAVPRPLPLPVSLVLAAGAGLALLVAFPRFDLWWLAPAGVALLAVAVHRRRLRAGLGLGFVTGAVFFAPLLAWTNLHVGNTPWLLLSAYQAVYLGLLGLALAWISPLADRRRAWWPLMIALLWSGQEALRDRTPFGGFPWGRLAFSQADAPTLALASLGGAPLVTFAVALAGGFLAALGWHLLVDAGGLRARLDAAAAGLLAGVAATLLVGVAVPGPSTTGQTVVVAVVQGNVPRLGLDFNAQRQAVLNNHVRETIALADRVRAGQAPQPQLVVWPENASDIDPLRDPVAAAAIDSAASAIKAPILVGAVLRGPGEGQARNAGIVWTPRGADGGGAGQMYLKQHPVPFAEYMPLRTIVEPIARAITDQAKLLRSDFVAGTGPGVLRMGPARVGDVICFEVAYDELVRDSVRAGGQLIAVQTNNATFDGAEAEQQLAMVRLRAVEHGRDSLMASTVGVSAFVTADGAVHDATGFNTADVIVRQLALRDSTTLATDLGMWPEALLALLAAATLVVAGLARRGARRPLVHETVQHGAADEVEGA